MHHFLQALYWAAGVAGQGVYSPLLLGGGEKTGDWTWFSSTEWLPSESWLRRDWRGGSGGGGRGGLLSGQSKDTGISGRGMSGALRIRSRELSGLSRGDSFLGLISLAIALAPTQWLLLQEQKQKHKKA